MAYVRLIWCCRPERDERISYLVAAGGALLLWWWRVVFALSLRYRRAVQTRTRLITEKGNTTTIPTAVISIIVVVLIIITTTDYPGESIITVLIAKSITNDSYLADRLMLVSYLVPATSSLLSIPQ